MCGLYELNVFTTVFKISSESLIKLYPVRVEKYISTNIITKVANIDENNKSSKMQLSLLINNVHINPIIIPCAIQTAATTLPKMKKTIISDVMLINTAYFLSSLKNTIHIYMGTIISRNKVYAIPVPIAIILNKINIAEKTAE